MESLSHRAALPVRSGVRRISSAASAGNIAFQRPEYAPTTRVTSPGENLPQIALRKLKQPRNPNAQPRPSIHQIDLSARLGIRVCQPVIGAQEWQTSTYHYNKATTKNLPVATQITNKLLESYVALKPMSMDSSGVARPEPPSFKNKRRKSDEKRFVSQSTVKDFGNKVVVHAFVYNHREQMEKARQAMANRSSGRRRQQS